MTYYWGDKSAAPPMKPSLPAIGAIGFLFVRDAFQGVAHFAERMSQALFSAANYEASRRAFHEQAVRELEALTEGRYWEVDSDEGLYVAALDEIELEEEDEEEDEELD